MDQRAAGHYKWGSYTKLLQSHIFSRLQVWHILIIDGETEPDQRPRAKVRAKSVTGASLTPKAPCDNSFILGVSVCLPACRSICLFAYFVTPPPPSILLVLE